MKIIYSGIYGENYDAARVPSFECNNFYLTLKHMKGVEVVEYIYDPIIAIGKEEWNKELLALVKKEKPDMLFAFMYTDEFDLKTLDEIKKLTTSVAWFADDYWRFFNYSKHWPAHFTYIVTTYSRAAEWYKKMGFENVILSQWACNTRTYKPVDIKKDIEVSFVGQCKPARAQAIEALRHAGVEVQCFGFGWPNGAVPEDKKLEIFGRSKINLNLTARQDIFSWSVIARIFLKRSMSTIAPDFHILDNLRAALHFGTPHTHARPFELAGCRAFVISGWSEDIGNYYEDGKEMVFYKNDRELEEKVRYFLAHDDEREHIARAGYERTMRDHTYEKRFTEIFKTAGLTN